MCVSLQSSCYTYNPHSAIVRPKRRRYIVHTLSLSLSGSGCLFVCTTILYRRWTLKKEQNFFQISAAFAVGHTRLNIWTGRIDGFSCAKNIIEKKINKLQITNYKASNNMARLVLMLIATVLPILCHGRIFQSKLSPVILSKYRTRIFLFFSYFVVVKWYVVEHLSWLLYLVKIRFIIFKCFVCCIRLICGCWLLVLY